MGKKFQELMEMGIEFFQRKISQQITNELPQEAENATGEVIKKPVLTIQENLRVEEDKINSKLNLKMGSEGGMQQKKNRYLLRNSISNNNYETAEENEGIGKGQVGRVGAKLGGDRLLMIQEMQIDSNRLDSNHLQDGQNRDLNFDQIQQHSRTPNQHMKINSSRNLLQNTFLQAKLGGSKSQKSLSTRVILKPSQRNFILSKNPSVHAFGRPILSQFQKDLNHSFDLNLSFPKPMGEMDLVHQISENRKLAQRSGSPSSGLGRNQLGRGLAPSHSHPDLGSNTRWVQPNPFLRHAPPKKEGQFIGFGRGQTRKTSKMNVSQTGQTARLKNPTPGLMPLHSARLNEFSRNKWGLKSGNKWGQALQAKSYYAQDGFSKSTPVSARSVSQDISINNSTFYYMQPSASFYNQTSSRHYHHHSKPRQYPSFASPMGFQHIKKGFNQFSQRNIGHNAHQNRTITSSNLKMSEAQRESQVWIQKIPLHEHWETSQTQERKIATMFEKVLVYASKIDTLQFKILKNNPDFPTKNLFTTFCHPEQNFMTCQGMRQFFQSFGLRFPDEFITRVFVFLSKYESEFLLLKRVIRECLELVS